MVRSPSNGKPSCHFHHREWKGENEELSQGEHLSVTRLDQVSVRASSGWLVREVKLTNWECFPFTRGWTGDVVCRFQHPALSLACLVSFNKAQIWSRCSRQIVQCSVSWTQLYLQSLSTSKSCVHGVNLSYKPGEGEKAAVNLPLQLATVEFPFRVLSPTKRTVNGTATL